MIVDPISLMMKYLDGESNLTNDEREILLFALYCESRDSNNSGLVGAAERRLERAGFKVVEPAMPQRELADRKARVKELEAYNVAIEKGLRELLRLMDFDEEKTKHWANLIFVLSAIRQEWLSLRHGAHGPWQRVVDLESLLAELISAAESFERTFKILGPKDPWYPAYSTLAVAVQKARGGKA